jgi:hypothetical protein
MEMLWMQPDVRQDRLTAQREHANQAINSIIGEPMAEEGIVTAIEPERALRNKGEARPPTSHSAVRQRPQL